MPHLEHLGRALAGFRKERGLSQAELGERALGLSGSAAKSRISGIETAKEAKNYELSTIDRILTVLGKDWGHLGVELRRLAGGRGEEEEAVAAEALGAVDDLVQRAMDETADRAARRTLDEFVRRLRGTTDR